MTYVVDTLERFNQKFRQFGKAEKNKIVTFIDAFQRGGFDAINHFQVGACTVRNKPSTDVPTDDPQFLSKINFARRHKLWHFHNAHRVLLTSICY